MASLSTVQSSPMRTSSSATPRRVFSVITILYSVCSKKLIHLGMANAGKDTNGSQFFITTVVTRYVQSLFCRVDIKANSMLTAGLMAVTSSSVKSSKATMSWRRLRTRKRRRASTDLFPRSRSPRAASW